MSRNGLQREQSEAISIALWRRYAEVVSEYAQSEKVHMVVLADVVQEIGRKVRGAKIEGVVLSSRRKTLVSAVQKIEQKGLEPHLSSLGDVCGVRVACRFASDVDLAVALVEDQWEVAGRDDKRAPKNPESFSYSGVHLDIKVPTGDALPGGFVRVEVQIRSLLQDVWAQISHASNYKGPGSLPGHLVRELSALSAELELADKHFDEILAWQKKYLATLLQGDAGDQEPLTKDSLRALCQAVFPDEIDEKEDLAYGMNAAWMAHNGLTLVGRVREAIQSGARELPRVRVAIPGTWTNLFCAHVSIAIAVPEYRKADVFPATILKRIEELDLAESSTSKKARRLRGTQQGPA